MYVCVLEKNSEKVLQIMVTYRKDRRMGNWENWETKQEVDQ